MQVQISKEASSVFGKVHISGSKSESNRLLILQAIFPEIQIENLSDSDDTKVLQKALSSSEEIVNIHHAGTAMRFLTAFFSSQKNRKLILTGSKRMQERPIKILVDALRGLGAEISYLKKEGFPPLQITGRDLSRNKTVLPANISSQYISALMLVAPALPNGLEINLEGKITSVPYINMTLQLLNQIGVKAFFENKKIVVPHLASVGQQKIIVEPDWSSASYFYSMVALSQQAKIKLFGFRKNSLQGDSVVAEIYENLGVKTIFEENAIVLEKIQHNKPKNLQLNLNNTPDLAQTIAVTCLGMGIPCELKGLHTLKIKETDRLLALKQEIEKFGVEVGITDECIGFSEVKKIKKDVCVKTYNDHRMALAFAPLALVLKITIEDYHVVSKSFPAFWDILKMLQFEVLEN